MLNILEVSERYEDQWVVLDKVQNVLDHGADLDELWSRHESALPKLTFYFASSSRR
jgi:hypothetical protein